MIKKVVQQGRSDFGAPSVLPVGEHGKMATCLRRAYSAEVASATKAGSRYARLRAKAGFSGERERRERRLAYSILKGGPFVFNSAIMFALILRPWSGEVLSQVPWGQNMTKINMPRNRGENKGG